MSSVSSLVIRLRETLNTCSTLIVSGDVDKSQESLTSLLEFLESVYDLNLIDPQDEENDDENDNAVVSTKIRIPGQDEDEIEVLDEFLRFLSYSSLDQVIVEALSLRVIGVIAKLGCVSVKCREVSERIIEFIVVTCNPRDMLSILCEALDPPVETLETPAYFLPILSGLSKVFVSIKRRHFEQIREAIPVVLNVVKSISLNSYGADKDIIERLFAVAINIGDSIQEVCLNLDRKEKELQALLGLYILQIMALVSLVDGEMSSFLIVAQLSAFIPVCNLSYSGLITGNEVESLRRTLTKDENCDCMRWFSFVKLGAALAVIWGYVSKDVAKAAKQDLEALMKLQLNQIIRWQTVGMLKHILTSVELSWNFKGHAIEFLLSITDRSSSEKCIEFADCSVYIPDLFATLQIIISVIIHAPDAAFRKNAFAVLKKVLSDIPPQQRYDMLVVLITNSTSSSMAAILIDLIKGDMVMVNPHNLTLTNDAHIQDNEAPMKSPFWSSNILELVEFVLKPSMGGPPLLPNQSDAVLSALNLYRYVLLAESKGKANYTEVLSKWNLEKAYKEWFLPLRMLITGLAQESKDCNELEMACCLNPVEMVLYRCIELVEEKLLQLA